jgi:Tropinone reductase 1
VHTVVSDMSSDEGRNALITAIDAKLGGTVRCLVNNVGSNIRKRAIEYSEPEYEHIMRTNLKSAFALTTKLHPQLKKAAMASVVNIGSVAGTTHST